MTNVAVVGAAGYAGVELANILKKHPHASVTGLYSSADFSVDAVANSGAEVVFLATPNEVSAEVVPQLLDRDMKVIDLSGAFRLTSPSLYPTWYGFSHEKPELLGEAVYGLPEWCNGELKKARLVANPGCYPTSILLALRPLTYILDREQPVICDSKSGVSGAGKKSDVSWSFAELYGNFKAYGVGSHRHEPEIRQGLRLGDRATLVFVPHLLPTVRGILSTMHVGFTHSVTDEEIVAIFAEAYAEAPFVRLLPPGEWPQTKYTVGSNCVHLQVAADDRSGRLVAVGAMDNLTKGTAGGAVQCMNLVLGLDEEAGLSTIGLAP